MKNNFMKKNTLLNSIRSKINSKLYIAMLALLTLSGCRSCDRENDDNETMKLKTFNIDKDVNASSVLNQASEAVSANYSVKVTSSADTWILGSADFDKIKYIKSSKNATLENPKNIIPNAKAVMMPRIVYEVLGNPTVMSQDTTNATYFTMSKFDKDKVKLGNNKIKMASDTLVLNATDEISTIKELYKETKNLASKTDKVYQTTLDELNTTFGESKIPNIGLKGSFGVVENHAKTQEITEAMKANKLRYNNGFYPMAKCVKIDVLTKTDVVGISGIIWLSNYNEIMKFKNEQGGNILRGRSVNTSNSGLATLNYYDWTINATTTPLYLSDLIKISTKFDYDTLMTYSSGEVENYMRLKPDANNNYYTIIYNIDDSVPDYPDITTGYVDTIQFIRLKYKLLITSHNIINQVKSKNR